MPHTDDILPAGKYAVVSCHAERPLDDEVWAAFSTLQRQRPGGFRIAALMRPPDRAAGEDGQRWLERAHEAASRGPVGLHTHWTAPDHARPTTGDPAALVHEQIQWLRDRAGIEPVAFCGGGFYMDEAVASVLGELGVADCTATAFRPGYLPADAPRLHVEEPAYVELPTRQHLLELPTTHGLRMLVRSTFSPLRTPLVHAYFHDTDLLDRRRHAALRAGLAILGRRRTPSDLAELQRRFRPAKTMSFANSRG
jgi:hypothetical protein